MKPISSKVNATTFGGGSASLVIVFFYTELTGRDMPAEVAIGIVMILGWICGFFRKENNA